MSKLDQRQTLITVPEEIPWKVPGGASPESVAEALLAGAEEQAGACLVLMKWYPGWMGAPHTYATDRLCVVVSGCGGATAARYDGALLGAGEPAVIAVTGTGPVRQSWVEPSQPPLRRL